jgi:hypothetical protein
MASRSGTVQVNFTTGVTPQSGGRLHADHLAMARADVADAREADAELRPALRSLDALFGPAVAEALHRRVEPLTDGADSAFGHYEQVVAERDRTIAELREELDVERTAHAETRAHRWAAERVLMSAIVDDDRRAARRKTDARPGWYRTAWDLLTGRSDAERLECLSATAGEA